MASYAAGSTTGVYAVVKTTVLWFDSEVRGNYVLCDDFLCNVEDIENNSKSWNIPAKRNGGKISRECYDGKDCDFVFVNFIPLPGNQTSISPKESKSSCVVLSDLCQCLQDFPKEIVKKKIKVTCDAQVFCYMFGELEKSRSFRRCVLSNLRRWFSKSKESSLYASSSNQLCSICCSELWKAHVVVNLKWPQRCVIDSEWSKKLQVLVNEKCELENSMAWLSTLGGAFSALGDIFEHCAKRAGVISLQQLCIAMRIGDPLTICRCKIYLAMSLLQRGRLKQAKKMILQQYEFSVSKEGKRDSRLCKMCIAVWNRLKYVSHLQKSSSEQE